MDLIIYNCGYPVVYDGAEESTSERFMFAKIDVLGMRGFPSISGIFYLGMSMVYMICLCRDSSKLTRRRTTSLEFLDQILFVWV